MVLIGDDPLLADGGHLVGEINSGEVSFNELFPDDAIDPDTTLDELNPVTDDGSQLTLSFQGHTFVFDSVRPEKVQALLLMLGGEEMSNVSNKAVPFELNHRVSNYGPQSLNNPHRIASLMRYREKRKNLCFDKKIHYSIRSEVASRLKRHKGQFASAKVNPEEAASTDPSSDSTERNCQEEKELPAFCQNCGISKDSTPLMRRGPAGPGSLCNACGLTWSNKGTVKNHLPPASNSQIGGPPIGKPELEVSVPSSQCFQQATQVGSSNCGGWQR